MKYKIVNSIRIVFGLLLIGFSLQMLIASFYNGNVTSNGLVDLTSFLGIISVVSVVFIFIFGVLWIIKGVRYFLGMKQALNSNLDTTNLDTNLNQNNLDKKIGTGIKVTGTLMIIFVVIALLPFFGFMFIILLWGGKLF